MRRYDDDIEVRPGGNNARVPQGAPEIFIWRGRLYLVRSVVDHWVERRQWWRDVFDRPRETSAPSRRVQGAAYAAAATSVSEARSTTLTVADLEREVWRVEASAGSSCAPGVYDLARVTGEPGHGDRWQLLGMSD